MNLDPKQLEAFCATVDGGSLSAAALALNVTLAATSLRIKALEERLGQRLLVRGKVARATAAGHALLTHIKQVKLLESDLANTLSPERGGYQSISVAVNADSVASWFMPGVQDTLVRQRMTLDVVVDDQDHTLEWLKNGDVLGCVTTLATPLRGCEAVPLGAMHYACVAAPGLAHRLSPVLRPSAQALLAVPAIGFNRKDALQDQFLRQYLGLVEVNYPRHYLPASDAYHQALLSGLGWGMLADIQHRADWASGRVVDLFPGWQVAVPLYWHHWLREAPQAARLTAAIQAAAALALHPMQQAVR